jgi:hypothetical protein
MPIKNFRQVLVVAVTSLMLAMACGGPSRKATSSSPQGTLPEFRIAAEDVSDIPIKTQVEQHIVVSGKITEDNLRELLRRQHAEIVSRSGFKYHASPTNVYIYLYDTEDRANAGQGLWLAMSQMSFGETEQQITVKSDQIERIGEEPQDKFGLAEAERQGIYKEAARLERTATDEAIERYPSDISRQLEFERRQKEKYREQLAAKYKLTSEELQATLLEGVIKQWTQ